MARKLSARYEQKPQPCSRSDPRDRFVMIPSASSWLAMIQICSEDDLFGAKSGAHGCGSPQDRGKCAASFAGRSCRVWQAPQGAVRVLFENLFHSLHCMSVTLLSLAVNPTPPILSGGPGVRYAPDHAEFPVRVLAAAFALVQLHLESRSNSSSSGNLIVLKTLNILKHENLFSGGNCSMPVRDARGSIEPAKAKVRRTDFSSAARWTHRQVGSSPPAKSPAAFFFRNFINTTLDCERCSHLRTRTPTKCRDLAETIEESIRVNPRLGRYLPHHSQAQRITRRL